MIDLGIKRRAIKLVNRINESTTTQLFILTSILQAVLVITLEIRVFHRNENTNEKLIIYARNNQDTADCLDPSVLRLNNIIEENVIFVIFQIFQMWLCFNAIYNQNTIQITIIAIINFFCACFGIVQMFEVQKWYNDFGRNCPDVKSALDFRPESYTYDIPLVVAFLVFGAIMTFLSWKLWREFGWNIYKKIGGDINKQAMHKTYLIYVMLLKFDLFFVLGLALYACTIFKVNLRINNTSIRHIRYLPRPCYLLHIGVSVLIFLNQIIGYRTVKKEMTYGIILVCVSWSIIIVDFGILLYFSIGNVSDSWYFFVSFLATGIIMTILSLIWSIFVFKNFGKGLQRYIDQEFKSLPISNNNNSNNNNNNNNNNINNNNNNNNNNLFDHRKKRFSIED